MYLYPLKMTPPTCKSNAVDAGACADADQCSYVLWESSFCNSADADTDATRSILLAANSFHGSSIISLLRSKKR